ncbi:hypothetical protein V1514DRAFT_201550 [Lipomyces japonicus]|uniref:uncharacterized protein n=1 Tax=Lipomyces japonicus TaxID=56871 RepID=UPI0034CFD51C
MPADKESKRKNNSVMDSISPFAFQIRLLASLSSIHEFLRKPININSSYDVDKRQLEYREFSLVIDEWRLSLLEKFSSVEALKHPISPLWINCFHFIIALLSG